jgi:tetratricopeptide (TPR) repeat protein
MQGRYKCYQQNEYEMSPCVRKWDEVHQALRIFSSETCEEIDIPPDAIPGTKILTQRGRFGRHFLSRDGSGGGRLGNDLHNLPQILKQNLYSCIRSLVDGDDVPVESDIEALKHRVSVIRLRHQADRLGLRCNPSRPWQLEQRSSTNDVDVHAADLVPDPSDWIPYNPETSKSPWDFADYFNHSEYGDFYRDQYMLQDDDFPISNDEESSENEETEEVASESGGVKRGKCGRVQETLPLDRKVVSSSSEDEAFEDCRTAMEVLYDTMLVLKDGGNAAMHGGKLDLAASRYDKAIQYGAVATMSFPVKNLEFAKDRIETLKDSGWHVIAWTPVLKLLIITRLNLALLMLKPYFSHPDQTVEQARLALEELKPFCTKKGKAVLDGVRRDDEPAKTFIDAKTLEAKAYFRLGSAQYELGDSEEAIHSFEQSVKSTQESNSKPDALVLRRLNEAKKESRRRNKKRKKKFKFAFGGKEN